MGIGGYGEKHVIDVKLIYDETTQHSDFEEADVDFCAECIRYFMKKHISYKEAEMKYTKKNLNFNSDEKF